MSGVKKRVFGFALVCTAVVRQPATRLLLLNATFLLSCRDNGWLQLLRISVFGAGPYDIFGCSCLVWHSSLFSSLARPYFLPQKNISCPGSKNRRSGRGNKISVDYLLWGRWRMAVEHSHRNLSKNSDIYVEVSVDVGTYDMYIYKT